MSGYGTWGVEHMAFPRCAEIRQDQAHGLEIDGRRGRLIEKVAFVTTGQLIDELEDELSPDRGVPTKKGTGARPSSRMLDCLRDAIRQGGVIRRAGVPGRWKTAAQEWTTTTVKALHDRGWVESNAGRFVVTSAGRKAVEEVGRE